MNFYADFLQKNLDDRTEFIKILRLLRPALQAQRVQDLKTPVGRKYMYMRKIKLENPEDAVQARFEAVCGELGLDDHTEDKTEP